MSLKSESYLQIHKILIKVKEELNQYYTKESEHLNTVNFNNTLTQ